MGGAFELWGAFREHVSALETFRRNTPDRIEQWATDWIKRNLVTGSAPCGGALHLWGQVKATLIPQLVSRAAKRNAEQEFPGGSKGRVNRAGDHVRAGVATAEDISVIEEWRASHRNVLNTFQATLRNRTKGQNVTVAQRHKRRRTIFDKLNRHPEMRLVRMDDVAGCRLIFESVDHLYAFREDFHKARFNHRRRNDVDKYDYIKSPKPTGYRGVHDVYEYDVQSNTNRHLTGLYVEIQYRTLVQHSWATAVEVIGFITESQPKFERGDDRYQEAMLYASEILARAMEKMAGRLPEMSDVDVVRNFRRLDSELHLLQTLKNLHAADKAYSQKKNAILVISEQGLDIYAFERGTDALGRLFELEDEFPERDVVLVKADTSEDVRIAFKNYFSDARDFVRYVEEGCASLRRRRPR